MTHFRSRPKARSIARDALLGFLMLAALGGAISVWSFGLQLFSAG